LVLEQLFPLCAADQRGLFLQQKVQARVDDAPGHDAEVISGEVHFATPLGEILGGDKSADGCETGEISV
jgi:hypothetical protein